MKWSKMIAVLFFALIINGCSSCAGSRMTNSTLMNGVNQNLSVNVYKGYPANGQNTANANVNRKVNSKNANVNRKVNSNSGPEIPRSANFLPPKRPVNGNK